MVVPRCERTGDVVEPMLTDQWFVDMRKAAPASHPPFRASRSRIFASRRSREGLAGGDGRRRKCASCPASGTRRTTTGSPTSRTGASRASSGGATGFPRGTARRATSTSRVTRLMRVPREPAWPRAAMLLRDEDVLDTWFSSALWCRSHARLAGGDAGARDVPSVDGADDRLRHHLLLGRPDDHDHDLFHRPRAVPRCVHERSRPRREGQKMSKSKGNFSIRST